MALREDIVLQSEWLVKAFASDGFKLDYSIESILEIDRFFSANMEGTNRKKGGRLDFEGFGQILFSIGAYVGETIIKNVEGVDWVTDDEDPMGELEIILRLPNGTIIWPVYKVVGRIKNGPEDSIYPYVHHFTKEYTNLPFREEFWAIVPKEVPPVRKPWWKFW